MVKFGAQWRLCWAWPRCEGLNSSVKSAAVTKWGLPGLGSTFLGRGCFPAQRSSAAAPQPPGQPRTLPPSQLAAIPRWLPARFGALPSALKHISADRTLAGKGFFCNSAPMRQETDLQTASMQQGHWQIGHQLKCSPSAFLPPVLLLSAALAWQRPPLLPSPT